MLPNFDVRELMAKLVILLIAFPLHELAHAVVADRLGDDTPRRMGRITLNPLAHLDLFGSLMLLLSFFGWAKPVLTNPRNFRNGPRAGTALVAIAGPAMNLALAVVGAIAFRALLPLVTNIEALPFNFIDNLFNFLFAFVAINIYLMLFNLLPIGPLDGMKVLRGVAPFAWDGFLDQVERWGMFILLGLVLFSSQVPILSFLIGGPANLLIRALLNA